MIGNLPATLSAVNGKGRILWIKIEVFFWTVRAHGVHRMMLQHNKRIWAFLVRVDQCLLFSDNVLLPSPRIAIRYQIIMQIEALAPAKSQARQTHRLIPHKVHRTCLWKCVKEKLTFCVANWALWVIRKLLGEEFDPIESIPYEDETAEIPADMEASRQRALTRESWRTGPLNSRERLVKWRTIPSEIKLEPEKWTKEKRNRNRRRRRRLNLDLVFLQRIQFLATGAETASLRVRVRWTILYKGSDIGSVFSKLGRTVLNKCANYLFSNIAKSLKF